MNMRISTQSIMGNYNRNLNKTIGNLDSSRMKVLTTRQFNYISEDPTAATKSFKLRREYARLSHHMENLDSTVALFDSVSSSILNVSKILNEDVNEDVLRAVNGATSKEARETYAKTLRGAQENIVLNLNAKYGNRFLFGGAEVKEVPFELNGEGRLTFRGLDVNDPANEEALREMMGESLYMDLGFGLQVDENGVIPSTAFDTATSGLKAIGYGNRDAEGNLQPDVITVLGQLADELEKDPFEEDTYKKFMDTFVECRNDAADFAADLGTKCEFLDNAKKKLTVNGDNLNKQIISTENVDMPAAISEYVWQQYAYNSALKVGTTILSQSFIDFMR